MTSRGGSLFLAPVYSFIAAFNLPGADGQDPGAFLRRTALIVRELMPTVGPSVQIATTVLPEVGGGWSLLLPEPMPRLGLLGQEVTDTHAVLIFGDLQRRASASAAKAVLSAWTSGGGDAVAALDGNFSAIVVDRAERTVAVVSDLLGRRTLRTLHAGGALYVSAHDVALAATGACPVEIDRGSSCSIVAADWSIGGRPLLTRVEPCDPAHWLRFQGGRLERLAAPLGLFEGRIDARDTAAVKGRIEQIVDILRANTGAVAAEYDTVNADLTAGLDSRASFSLLASVLPAERIVARTSGAPDCLDVRVARRIAKLAGVRHEPRALEPPVCDDFGRYSSLIAFHMNGDSSAKRAIDRYPAWDEGRPLSVDGGGGEILRGYYYGRPGQYRRVARASAGDIASWFVRKWRRLSALPWRSPDAAAAVHERVQTAVEVMFRRSPDVHDVLDQFYLFERYGRWGAITSRFTWWKSWTPYASPAVVRLAYGLPSPIGTYAAVHDAAVRRFLPEARTILVNNNALLPLQGPGLARKVARDLLYVSGELWRAAAAWRARAVREQRSVDALRADAIAGPLHDYARDVLLSRDSIAVELLGHDAVARLLDEHRAHRRHLEGLCNLLSIEHWRRLVTAAAARGAG
ncbi:hypothetical protein [Sorangium sp. So ce131]|uniref:hypothetical protein n=1 Tax=Sorangium sp. So ce131 TaxID=3133282 RepID=UPI003F5E8B91